MTDNSIDSIVTDPPYELGFMEEDWDRTGIAFNIELWRECLRVLKPGGYLLAFGGARTYHRMACAVEDAGFEIRDQIMWLFGGGFPKPFNLEKAIAKVSSETEAKRWAGWGSTLKPAHTPICVARKPLSEKTLARNVLRWGTGGINISECKIPIDLELDASQLRTIKRNRRRNTNEQKWGFSKKGGSVAQALSCEGRFPANVILDEETGKLLDQQSGILKSGKNCIRRKEGRFLKHTGLGKAGDVQTTHDDMGGASRFFYCARASGAERGEFNIHPSVKPLSLVKYLVKLVTPSEGICLDPFEGSGTHALACLELGAQFIGFEKEEKYYNIALRRIQNYYMVKAGQARREK